MNTSETARSSDLKPVNFENFKYEIVDNSDDILLDNSGDQDVNFFNKNPEPRLTIYITERISKVN